LEPLKLFFGFITIQEYIYRYKLSMAKIQLMSMDVSRIDYSDKKGERKQKSVVIDKAAIDLNAESIRKRRERMANKLQEAIPIDVTGEFNNI